jgi:hypothetical protein
MVGAKKLKDINTLTQYICKGDDSQECRHYNPVYRPRKGTPRHGSYCQLQHNAHSYQAYANSKALLHLPRFIPHMYLFNLAAKLVKKAYVLHVLNGFFD